MKILLNSLYISITAVLLVSCGESEQPVEPVSWYKVNKAEREAMLARCRADPDLMAKDKRCQNAESAEKYSPKAWGIEDGIR